MSTFTQQQTFDMVITNMRTQGLPSVGLYGRCLYRGPHGRKCAAGGIIPDERFSPLFEDSNALVHVVECGEAATNPVCCVLRELGHDVELVAELQTAHDLYATQSPEEWRYEIELNFARIAKNRYLNFTPR